MDNRGKHEQDNREHTIWTIGKTRHVQYRKQHFDNSGKHDLYNREHTTSRTVTAVKTSRNTILVFSFKTKVYVRNTLGMPVKLCSERLFGAEMGPYRYYLRAQGTTIQFEVSKDYPPSSPRKSRYKKAKYYI